MPMKPSAITGVAACQWLMPLERSTTSSRSLVILLSVNSAAKNIETGSVISRNDGSNSDVM